MGKESLTKTSAIVLGTADAATSLAQAGSWHEESFADIWFKQEYVTSDITVLGNSLWFPRLNGQHSWTDRVTGHEGTEFDPAPVWSSNYQWITVNVEYGYDTINDKATRNTWKDEVIGYWY